MTASGLTRRLVTVFPLPVLLACTISCTSPSPPGTAATQNLSPDLEPFLRSYFATWSAGEMRRYSDHFHRKAVITFIKDGEVDSSLPRDRFVMLQTAARARLKGKSVERMTSFTADEDERAATVVAQWELTKGTGDVKKVSRGVDRFTLMRDERGKWKIAALVFYETE